MLDWMGVYQHHDAVSGTAKQHVADNYVLHLSRAMNENNLIYDQELINDMNKTTGYEAQNLMHCIGNQNETVTSCPAQEMMNASEFIVVVHNPASQTFNQLVRI